MVLFYFYFLIYSFFHSLIIHECRNNATNVVGGLKHVRTCKYDLKQYFHVLWDFITTLFSIASQIS